MGLLLEDEADCLNHQHKHRCHWPPIRRQSGAAAPYRASGLVHRPISDNQSKRTPTSRFRQRAAILISRHAIVVQFEKSNLGGLQNGLYNSTC